MADIDDLVERAGAEFRAAADGASLENAKARYLGKSGELTALLKTLGALARSTMWSTSAIPAPFATRSVD